jgi:hypothetical protein
MLRVMPSAAQAEADEDAGEEAAAVDDRPERARMTG